MDTEMAAGVGAGPGTSLRQDRSGLTQFEEHRENGYHKLTSVDPDGSVSTKIDRTDPSTGITTSIERFADGTVSKTTEWPGGQTQSVVRLPDGTQEQTRTFQAPDGSTYKQIAFADGSLQTTHERHEPDGTFRQTVRRADGSIETTLEKSYEDPDGSKITQTKTPNGDLKTKVERLDGSSETTTVHADGSRDKVIVSHTEDGKLVIHEVRADGTETTDTRWVSPDGHEHRTVVDPDGSTRAYENWEETLPDQTKVLHFNRPEGNETTTIRPDGSTETVKEHPDGTASTFSRTIEPDGSIHEHHVNSNGLVRDAHYRQNPDGSFTTETRDFDGTQRTTMVGPDGRVEVHEIGPAGTRTDTTYSSDGSGRRDVTDADGHLQSTMDIDPHPRPVPLPDNPETFLALAERELPPNIGAPPDGTVDGLPIADSRIMSQAEVDALSERGIAGPIGRANPTELDDAAISEPVGLDLPEVEMPAGALGDPTALTRPYETQRESPITQEPFAEEGIWSGEETIERMDPAGEIEDELASVDVDGPEETFVTEEQVWPGEESTEMDPVVEYEPGPAVEAEPAVESPPPSEPDL